MHGKLLLIVQKLQQTNFVQIHTNFYFNAKIVVTYF